MSMIDGVSIYTKKSATVCIIEKLSDDLKSEIRGNLASICHGSDSVAAGSTFSTYELTLREFNRRYETKSENIKKGMIGELLAHILLFKSNANFLSANPFFNMEESSIKKGFDLIVFDKNNHQVWISEVKSGNAKQVLANKFNKALLNTAKNDLKNRLGENATHLWLNAINGAKIALSEGKAKSEIKQTLEDSYQEAADEIQVSSSKNVILISITYKNTNDPITLKEVNKKRKSIKTENTFRKIIVFSIQKETYQLVAEFLKSEVPE